MCETLGTNWEGTARQALSDKVKAYNNLERIEELADYLLKSDNVKTHIPDGGVSESFVIGMRQGFLKASTLLFKALDHEHGNTCRDVLCGGCVEFVDGEANV